MKNNKKRRAVLTILGLSGLLGLAPAWYQFHSAVPGKINYAHGPQRTAANTFTSAPKPIHAQNLADYRQESRVHDMSNPAQPGFETDHPAETVLEPHGPAAIESFQTGARLSRGRPDPELVEALGLEAADGSSPR